MTHLNEEQIVDLLLEEPGAEALRPHLEHCAECRDRFDRAASGLRATRAAAPRVPEMPRLPISYRRFQRTALLTRAGWIAAAAMFALSLMGFQFEYEQGRFAVGFSLAGAFQEETASADAERIAELESRLLEAIELKSELTRSSVDARFEALYQERGEELYRMSDDFKRALENMELQQAQYAGAVRDELREEVAKSSLGRTP